MTHERLYLSTHDHDTAFEVTGVYNPHNVENPHRITMRVYGRMNDGSWRVSNERAVFKIVTVTALMDAGRWVAVPCKPTTNDIHAALERARFTLTK